MTKTVFITGSTDGIGKALALELTKKNYQVLLHGRKKERLETTIKEIKEATGKTLKGYIADLSDFEQVTRMCEEIKKDFPYLDVILHNAGTYEQTLVWNPDRIEKTMAVNYVSNVLINEKLYDYFLHSHQVTSQPVRVILTSSVAHQSGKYSFTEWMAPKHFNGYIAYANSKMAQIMYGYYIAEKYKDKGITVNSLHPGVIDTKILRDNFGIMGAPLREGIKTSMYLVTSDEVKNITGKYFDNSKITRSAPETYNTSYQKELYEKTLEILTPYL